MNNNTLYLGQWNVVCDVCGWKIKSSDAKERWDGLIVCPKDYETRHPMDFIKAPRPDKPLPFTRPEQADVFVGPTYIDTSIGNQETTVPSGTFNSETQ